MIFTPEAIVSMLETIDVKNTRFFVFSKIPPLASIISFARMPLRISGCSVKNAPITTIKIKI
jgi:hypothetical protein